MRSKRQNSIIILILGSLSAVTPFSIDMYLPSFPEIARDLGTSTGKVALSISTYFVGFALGQILYGPLLDRFGRKRPLYAGLGLYLLATLGCMAANSVEQLLALRFIQALGGCVAMVASRTMVRDFFPVEDAARVYSLLVLILGVSPLLAPTAGSFVAAAWGWQAVFASLAVIVAAILACVFFFLPDGRDPDPEVSLRLLPILRNFKAILRQPQFFVYTISGALSFSGLFVYVAGSPSIFMDWFHVSAKAYGGIFALLSVGIIGGSQLNLALTRRFRGESIFRAALALQVTAASLFFIGAVNSWYGLAATIAFLFAVLLGAGLGSPNSTAIALAPFSRNAGSASALMGFIQIGLGAVFSAGAGALDSHGAVPTAAAMALSSLLALAILLCWGGGRSSSR